MFPYELSAMECLLNEPVTNEGNSLVLPYGVGIVGMVGNELGKTPRLPILSQLDTSYHILLLF